MTEGWREVTPPIIVSPVALLLWVLVETDVDSCSMSTWDGIGEMDVRGVLSGRVETESSRTKMFLDTKPFSAIRIDHVCNSDETQTPI